MEMANHWSEAKTADRIVRTAVRQDTTDIMLLLQNGRYTHMHLDWRPPADWVGEKGFVVVPDKNAMPASFTSALFSPRSNLAACLAAVADPGPAAWVRAVAFKQTEGAETLLAAMLERVTNHLQETAVTELGWLVMNDWPLKWLAPCGFRQINEIATYIKYDMAVPQQPAIAELSMRTARIDDMEFLARLEEAAFEPLWRHSADSLCLAYQQAFSFDVAIWNGRLVGFQYSTRNRDNAHLVRMTVLPELHRKGIGSALLAHAIQGYKKHNLRYITLNTQIDNLPSQKLYAKYGFQPQGQRLPIWVKSLAANMDNAKATGNWQ